MKKLFFTFTMVIATFYSYGQTNTLPSSGNVGIGITNPILGSLTIAAADKNTLSAIAIRQNNNTAYGFDFGLDQEIDGCGYIFAINGINKVGLIRLDRNNNTVTFNGGNVGIGTNNPKEKLSVNGNIRAHEIKVETANWPDYVFMANYQLPSLQETEQYIKKKGHLPGIPSAEDVKVNGVDLGDMNTRLLKKIEELTLYLIEMKKENEVQTKKLQKEINKLKSIK